MVNAILILFAINLISFLTFLIRKGLDDEHWGGISIVDELSVILAIGGSFGAFVAMKVNKAGIEDDASFKIAIPISMIIQAIVIAYLVLYELGIVK